MNPNKSCYCKPPQMGIHHVDPHHSCKPPIQPPPPPPPLPHHHDHFPYERPAHDSYGSMCGGHNHYPDTFPVTGPFIGNAFVLKDTMPYLVDSSFMEYGQTLCFSESIYTKITQRKDTSCINLNAVLDMTDTMLTNGVRNDFLEKNIAKKYSALNGLLPIIKHGLKFYIYYTITNVDGGVEYEGVAVTYSPEMRIHFTDIRDVFVSSIRNVVIENIPAMTYQGMYTITIDRAEAYVAVIDTPMHVEDDLNPFYSFTNNNMSIKLNHSEIASQSHDDGFIMIAECCINKSFDYRANLTTRLRISFVAFMSHLIITGDTSGVWDNLNTPTEEIITNITNDVKQLGDEIKMLKEIIEHQNLLIEKLNGDITNNTNDIIEINTKITDINEIINDHEQRIIDLESIPRAVRRYHIDTEYIEGQLVWNKAGKLYQVSKNFNSQSGEDKNECMSTDIKNGNLVPLEIDNNSIAVVRKYEKGVTLKIGQLVYNKSGELCQVVNDYTTTNDININIEEAYIQDINRGNLKPIGWDMSNLEQKIENNTSEISELKHTISQLNLNKVGNYDSVQTVIKTVSG